MELSTNTLKSAQLKAVYRMLAFNEDTGAENDSDFTLPPAGTSHNQWKILIYDVPCRSIISPLMSVSQLRRRGVTLHLLLHSDREAIPDVPAVYFVTPTKENLARIAQDCGKRLYGRAHLNFVTKLDRSLMEEFAKLVVQTGSLDVVSSVHDQYLDYVCLEKHLFSLHKPNSYVTYNGSGATEQSIEAAMTEIAYGLFSVVATLGQIPVIRCPKGGAPEMVARKLNKMIAEHPTLLRNKGGGVRPLLVILDRNADLITPLQHTSTYQALIDDVLTHKANRVEFVVTQDADSKRPKKIPKKFDLDPDEDSFYCSHKFQPFPEAIESNGVELQAVTDREQQIRSKAVGGGGASIIPDPMANAASDLATAVDSLPALLEQKKQLEMHTSILQAVMNEVAARDVPQFYELESSLATGQYKNDLAQAKKDVIALVGDPTKGNVEDKIRLVMVFCLATTAKSADIDAVTQAMQQGVDQMEGVDRAAKEKVQVGIKATQYLKQLRTMHMIPSMAEMSLADGGDASSGAGLGNFLSLATTQATGLLSKATSKVTAMLGKIHKHHATLVVENLCEMRPGTEDEQFLYLDPKVKGEVDIAKLQNMTRSPVREAIVFMVGGGCYAEYQNLQMVATDRRTISYGSTELVDAGQFLQQLGQLG